MELFFECLTILILFSGLGYFVFGIKNILWYIGYIAGFISWCAGWILAGFLIGIGIHIVNLTFGW